MRKKLDEAVGRIQFGSLRNFLNPIICKLDKHVVRLHINYREDNKRACGGMKFLVNCSTPYLTKEIPYLPATMTYFFM